MDSHQSRRDLLLTIAAAAAALSGSAEAAAPGQAANAAPPQNNPTAPASPANQASTVIDNVNNHLRQMQATSAAPAGPSQPLYARDPAVWAQIQSRANSYLSLQQRSLESAFQYKSADEDAAFRMQHAEILLQQIAALLERGLGLRSTWNQMQAAAFNVKVQLQNFFELDAIHQEETLAGFYDHTPREAELQTAAEGLATSGLEGHAKALQDIDMGFYSDVPRLAAMQYNALMAWFSHVPDLTTSQAPYPYTNPYSPADKGTSAEITQRATYSATQTALTLQQSTLWAQLASVAGGIPSSQNRTRASSVRSAWETKNAGFRLRRTEVSRRLADLKADAYTSPGGPLNYPEQMTRLETSFQRDFRDALARVRPAADGMQKLYGFGQVIPATVSAVLNGGTPEPQAYDDCLNWVRDALSYVTRFSQTEQRCSLTVSVKQLVGNDPFARGQRARPWATWTVSIPNTLFPDQLYVRLRGVSVYVTGDRSDGVWRARVRAPTSSFCERMGPQGPVRQELDQSKLPTTMAGRISFRGHVRPPDIAGAITLFNASPFGDWNLELVPASSDGKPVEQLDDVSLELHVAVRMRA